MEATHSQYTPPQSSLLLSEPEYSLSDAERYTLSNKYCYIFLCVNPNIAEVRLPDSSLNNGVSYCIKISSNSTGNITLKAVGVGQIEGENGIYQNAHTLLATRRYIFLSDGSNWRLISFN